MSNNTVNAALRRLGYSNEQMTGHGFRSMASTLLNEQGWHPDAIERQLAHQEQNEIRAAYNYAKHLPERRKMMQAWADYLYRLRSTAAAIPPKSGELVRERRAQNSCGATEECLSGEGEKTKGTPTTLPADRRPERRGEDDVRPRILAERRSCTEFRQRRSHCERAVAAATRARRRLLRRD